MIKDPFMVLVLPAQRVYYPPVLSTLQTLTFNLHTRTHDHH